MVAKPAPIIGIFLLVVMLGVSACDRWGTMEEAENLYHDRKSEFEMLLRSLAAHPEFRHISHVFTPEKKNMKFNEQYADLSDETEAIYMDLVRQMEALSVQRIKVYLRGDLGTDDEARIYDFYVFSRGIGGDTESIEIVHGSREGLVELNPNPSSTCRLIDRPEWYVCHTK